MERTCIPEFIRENYGIDEWKHAVAILVKDFPEEWQDICDALLSFELKKSEITVGGGSKSKVTKFLEGYFKDRGWIEKSVKTGFIVNGKPRKHESATHKIDCFRNSIALEIEWNSKDSVYVRDLGNFSRLYELDVVSVGVIITRSDELQELFKKLDIGRKYGGSTTHAGKLTNRIERGEAGGCPVLVFAIKKTLYREDC